MEVCFLIRPQFRRIVGNGLTAGSHRECKCPTRACSPSAHSARGSKIHDLNQKNKAHPKRC